MSFKPRLSLLAGGLCVGVLSVCQAGATTTSYSGVLASDDSVMSYSYVVSAPTTVTFQTDSYGGGVTNGLPVASGGFVPVLSLFGPTGTTIGSDGADATCYAGMMMDGMTGMCDDAFLKETLAAGTYTLTVSEFFNEPVGPNLSDGFTMANTGNFTAATCGATTGAFYQSDIAPCVQRDDIFSVNATATGASPTPEPSTLWFGALPLIFAGLLRRRKQN